MEQITPTITPDRPFCIPTAVWVGAAGLVAALVAIFVLKVAPGTVLTYGLIGLMAFSHLFMHSGHGSHSGHSGHAGNEGRTGAAANVDGPVDVAESKDKHAGHSGGCC